VPVSLASGDVRRRLPTAGGKGIPFGLPPTLASPCPTRRSHPGAPKLTMSQQLWSKVFWNGILVLIPLYVTAPVIALCVYVLV
jgi:hypothetical protein